MASGGPREPPVESLRRANSSASAHDRAWPKLQGRQV